MISSGSVSSTVLPRTTSCAPPGGQHVPHPVDGRAVGQRENVVAIVPKDVHRGPMDTSGLASAMDHDREAGQVTRDRARERIDEPFRERADRREEGCSHAGAVHHECDNRARCNRSFARVRRQDGRRLRVPASAVEALGKGKRPPVVVTINGYTYRNTVAVYGDEY